jgi:hypothetical protein
MLKTPQQNKLVEKIKLPMNSTNDYQQIINYRVTSLSKLHQALLGILKQIAIHLRKKVKASHDVLRQVKREMNS